MMTRAIYTNGKIRRYATVLCKQLEADKRRGVTHVIMYRPGFLLEAACEEIKANFQHRADKLPIIVMQGDDVSSLGLRV